MKKFLHKSFNLTCLALAFMVSMPIRLVSPFLSLCMIFMFLLLVTSGFKIQGSRSRNQLLIVFISFTIFSLISLTYTENRDQGLALLARRIVLLLIPIFLLFDGNHKQKREMLLSFILGNYVIVIYLAGVFLYSYFSSNQSSLLSNKSLLFKETLIEYTHPSYLGLNLSLCLLSIAYFVKGSNSLKGHLWMGASTVAGFLVIYLSYARMGFIVFSLTAFYIYFMILYENSRKITWIISTILLAVICIVAVLNNSRFTSILNSDEASQENHTDYIGYTQRISIWTRAIELIVEQPLFGYGLGDSGDVLNWNYDGRKYNAHNQFLEFLLEGGIISLLLFMISFLGLMFRKKGQVNLWFNVGVIGIFLLVMLTESILNRIAGIASFALFLWILSGKEIKVEYNMAPRVFSWLSFMMLSLLLTSLGIVLFTSSFNPGNPRTFADRVSRIVNYQDLPGILPESLPEEIKGYMFDRQTNASTWDGNAYAYTSFHQLTAEGNEVLKASVYCYVSEDFNGNWVRLSAEGPEIRNKASFYDLTKKGTWQVLEINPELVPGNTTVELFMSKYGCQSFESLEGFVIFAFPQYEITIPAPQ